MAGADECDVFRSRHDEPVVVLANIGESIEHPYQLQLHQLEQQSAAILPVVGSLKTMPGRDGNSVGELSTTVLGARIEDRRSQGYRVQSEHILLPLF